MADRWEAQAEALRFVVGLLPLDKARAYAKHWREIAAGEPETRAYIADLIEGKVPVTVAPSPSSGPSEAEVEAGKRAAWDVLAKHGATYKSRAVIYQSGITAWYEQVTDEVARAVLSAARSIGGKEDEE